MVSFRFRIARILQHELADAERLGDVIVRAELEADDAIDLFALRRENDDGDTLRAAVVLDRPADFGAGDVGEHEIEQHQIRMLVVNQLEAVLPLGRREHVVAGHSQVVIEHLANIGFVFDDENACHQRQPGYRTRVNAR